MDEIQEVPRTVPVTITAGFKIELSGGKADIILDMSKFDLFALCEARYNMRYNLKRALPIYQKSKSLDLGAIGHIGMEEYFNLLQKGEHFNDRMHKSIMKMRVFANDPKLSSADPEEIQLICNAVEESCDYWRAEDENELEVLFVESPFMYLLHEDDYVRIWVSGKIDLVANKHGIGNNASYKNLPYDHKTQSRNFLAPELSNQFENYCVATNSHYLIVNKIGLQKTLRPEEKYSRVPYSYDPLQLDDWKENVTKVILGRYLQCVADNEWLMNFTSCLKFNRLCEYYEVCKRSGKQAKQEALDNNYVEAEEWDVTKGLVND